MEVRELHMRNYICKGTSETMTKIIEFKVVANGLIEATQNAYKQCYEKNLNFIEIKELGKDLESSVSC
jgi:hypothetical protein